MLLKKPQLARRSGPGDASVGSMTRVETSLCQHPVPTALTVEHLFLPLLPLSFPPPNIVPSFFSAVFVFCSLHLSQRPCRPPLRPCFMRSDFAETPFNRMWSGRGRMFMMFGELKLSWKVLENARFLCSTSAVIHRALDLLGISCSIFFLWLEGFCSSSCQWLVRIRFIRHRASWHPPVSATSRHLMLSVIQVDFCSWITWSPPTHWCWTALLRLPVFTWQSAPTYRYFGEPCFFFNNSTAQNSRRRTQRYYL